MRRQGQPGWAACGLVGSTHALLQGLVLVLVLLRAHLDPDVDHLSGDAGG